MHACMHANLPLLRLQETAHAPDNLESTMKSTRKELTPVLAEESITTCNRAKEVSLVAKIPYRPCRTATGQANVYSLTCHCTSYLRTEFGVVKHNVK